MVPLSPDLITLPACQESSKKRRSRRLGSTRYCRVAFFAIHALDFSYQPGAIDVILGGDTVSLHSIICCCLCWQRLQNCYLCCEKVRPACVCRLTNQLHTPNSDSRRKARHLLLSSQQSGMMLHSRITKAKAGTGCLIDTTTQLSSAEHRTSQSHILSTHC